MAIIREWKSRPPQWKMRNLHDLAADYYMRRYWPESEVSRDWDDICTMCAEADTIEDAISYAVLSYRPNGKKHNHQSKVRVLPQWNLHLQQAKNIRYIWDSTTFHDLLVHLENFKIPGIGPTTCYDVATRVGYFMRLYPRNVYIHAGVAMGARALGLYPPQHAEAVRTGAPLRWYEPLEFPAPLRSFPVNDIEDFLCCYREAIGSRYIQTDRWFPASRIRTRAG